MPLSAFSFPFPETRFFKAGSLIYKFKIRGGSSYSGEEVMGDNCFNQELEEIVRTVLGNLDSLQPFSSPHLNVFPYKKPSEKGSRVICNQHDRNLRAYPFVIFLFLEKNMERVEDTGKSAEEKLSSDEEAVPEPRSKRWKTDSPLDEAVLKGLTNDLEAERWILSTGRQCVYNSRMRGEVKEDLGRVDKEGTRGFTEPQLKLDVSTVRGNGTPGEVHPGDMQDVRQAEDEEEEENADPVLDSPARPGILSWLARLLR